MFYTVYKITNKIDGKIYIGSHKTRNLDDGYMGSGKYLRRAQEKYGIDNFEKEIMFIFETAEEMFLKEAELVSEDFISIANTYNLKVGGNGGFQYINANNKNVYGNNGKRGYGGENLVRGNPISDETKLKISESLKHGDYKPFLGRKHSDETKRIISQKAMINQSGSKNSQYGTRWIHSLSLQICRKIGKDDHLPEGWNEGRKIKW